MWRMATCASDMLPQRSCLGNKTEAGAEEVVSAPDFCASTKLPR